MTDRQDPNWQPIINTPIIARMIDTQVIETKSQYENFLEILKKTYMLDEYTVERIWKVFNVQREFIRIYKKQLLRWETEKLSPAQQAEITRLYGQIEQWNKIVTDMWALIEKLKLGSGIINDGKRD